MKLLERLPHISHFFTISSFIFFQSPQHIAYHYMYSSFHHKGVAKSQKLLSMNYTECCTRPWISYPKTIALFLWKVSLKVKHMQRLQKKWISAWNLSTDTNKRQWNFCEKNLKIICRCCFCYSIVHSDSTLSPHPIYYLFIWKVLIEKLLLINSKLPILYI